MPRRLLRDGQVVVDDWLYLTEIEDAQSARSAADSGAGMLTEAVHGKGGTAAGAERNAAPVADRMSGKAPDAAGNVAGANGGAHAAPPPAVIIPFERWLREREAWLGRSGRLGVLLLPADKVEQLASDVARLALIAAEFPGPSDGRGYTQGRLLRERYRFTGELRAAGYVRRDQLFFLARCGFNSFQLPDGEFATAAAAFTTFAAEYQPSNDMGLARKLQHR